jgi:hypothetical protein
MHKMDKISKKKYFCTNCINWGHSACLSACFNAVAAVNIFVKLVLRGHTGRYFHVLLKIS